MWVMVMHTCQWCVLVSFRIYLKYAHRQPPCAGRPFGIRCSDTYPWIILLGTKQARTFSSFTGQGCLSCGVVPAQAEAARLASIRRLPSS